MSKFLQIALLVLITTGCQKTSSIKNSEDTSVRQYIIVGEKIHNEVFNNKSLRYVHVTAHETKTVNTKIIKGESFGNIQHYPEIFSKKYNGEYLESVILYNRGEYEKSATILKKTIEIEKDNFFLLNQYSKSLYRVPNKRDESYRYYLKLNELLESQSDDGNEIVLDMWFIDAYWKLGTLYLDNKEYSQAILQISKLLISSANRSNPALFEQAYEYLAESYYYLGNYSNARYYANLVLKLNPNNEYAQYYANKP